MNERETWSELRGRRMHSTVAARAYEEARAAYDVGRMVRNMREAHGLSQRQLAEQMGTTQSVVGRLESGGSRPTLATLERLADALGLQLEIRFHEEPAGHSERRGRAIRGAVRPAARPERRSPAARG